jgi:5'-nucleotidase
MSRIAPLSLVVAALLVTSARTAHAIPITIVGTSDLHGRVERIPILAADVAEVKAELAAQKGGVAWLDGGDLFQGTLESNSVEGKSVVDAYNVNGPDAVAIGNHEFDYGPEGPSTTASKPSDDPRGALKARIASAKFPFLAANLIDEATGKTPSWAKASTMLTIAGVKIGVIGLTTIDTATTTTATNLKGLKVIALKDAVLAEAPSLRKQGAQMIAVTAHAGGNCNSLADPNDLSTCEKDSEIFQLANALPAGTVDVIVAGHTHKQIAQVVNGIPIIESWANGRGFGRVDLDVTSGKVTLVKVHTPQKLCVDTGLKDDEGACQPADVDGQHIAADAKVQAAIQPYVDAAKKVKDRKLGVVVKSELKRGYDTESALGNLFADAMLEGAHDAKWKADVALINGGGIRQNLPAGDLTYGHVYEMMPFDNRFARISTTGKVLREWLERNLSATKGGTLSISGATADIACDGGKAKVTLKRVDGNPLGDAEHVDVVTTDFLATGGESTKLPPESITLDDGDPIREFVARVLQKHGGTLDGDDPKLFDKSHRRLNPGRCKGSPPRE